MPARITFATLAFVFIAASTLPGAFGQEIQGSPMDPIVTAANELGFALAPKLSTEGNRFYSSASITSALLMAYAGSRGETASEIATTLGLGDLEPTSQDLDRAMAALISSLNRQTSEEQIARYRRHDPKYEGTLILKLVNAFWGQTGHPFRADYLKRLASSYGSRLKGLDFRSDPELCRKIINDAVASDTKDKIRDLLPEDSITPITRLVLTNAIYFKNSWADEFYQRATRDQTFEASPASSFPVPMMRKTNYFALAETDALRMVRIPYAEGGQSMLVVLPKARHELAAVEKGMNGVGFRALVASMKLSQVALELPRFKIAQSYELVDALAALGIRRAFDPTRADFSGIDDGKGQLVISRVVHKTFVAVDERGTEAAAATAMMMKAGAAAPRGEPVPFVCDQPFLFFIVDDATGLNLFQGRCVDPRN